MRETYVLQVLRDEAARHLGARVGVPDGDRYLRVIVERDDPLLERIAAVERELHRRGLAFVIDWNIRRDYTRDEIAAAEVFGFAFEKELWSTGVDSGTEYDESSVCWQELKFDLPDPPSWWALPSCGAGRRQVSGLRLDLWELRPTLDVARTRAHEWVVSQRFRDLWLEAGLTGAAFGPVVPVGRGRRNEQVRYQLKVTSGAVELHEDSRFGLSPFHPSEEGYHTCPLGHLFGLNLVSELFLRRASYDGSDIVATRQLVGAHQGYVWPGPLLAVSPRAYHLLRARKIKGAVMQVAYLR